MFSNVICNLIKNKNKLITHPIFHPILINKINSYFIDKQLVRCCKFFNKGGKLSDIPIECRTTAICLEAMKIRNSSFDAIPEDKKTEEICLLAVKGEPQYIKFMPDDKKTEEICSHVVTYYGRYLQYIPEEKKTMTLCLIAIKQLTSSSGCFEFVPEKLKTWELCMEACRYSSDAIKNLPTKFQSRRAEFVLENLLFQSELKLKK